MNLLFILIFSLLSGYPPQHPVEKQFEFSIIFSGSFEKDTISLDINQKHIIRSFLLDNIDPDKKGHLNLSQYESNLSIHYNGKNITKEKISVDHTLHLLVRINKEIKKCTIDLRKGKAIVIDYRTVLLNNKNKREIFVEQIAEPTILF